MRHENGTEYGNFAVKVEGLVTVDRSSFDASDLVEELWTGLGLPSEALSRLHLEGDSDPALPSSFRIGPLAQSSIALSALAAAQLHALRNDIEAPQVEVSLQHAVVEFKSERVYIIDKQPYSSPQNRIGGLHKTADGYIRVHDSFPNHSNGMLELFGLPIGSKREQLANEIAKWRSVELENIATVKGNLAAYALRSYGEWNALPQSQAISEFPIHVQPSSSNRVKASRDELPKDQSSV